MDVEKFKNSPMGTLSRIAGVDGRRHETYEHFAFIPKPLSDDLVFQTATHNKVARASILIGRLQEATRKLPNPAVLLQPSLRREAQSTSALEGTYAPLNAIFEGDFLDDSQLKEEVREILNYVRAANRALELIKNKPICITVLSELQGILVQNTKGARLDQGKVRSGQVIIGDENKPVTESRFVPPPPGDILDVGLSDWEKWINSDSEISPIIKAALGHYQFETLHPYSDGNGRLGRLVISLQFVEAGVLDQPILNLSDWFNLDKDLYRNRLLNVSLTGDLDTWIKYFCEAVINQSEIEIKRIDSLIEFRVQLTQALLKGKERGIIFQMAESLVESPMLSIQDLANRHSVSYPTASTAVKKLVQMGILRELTGARYQKLYVCMGILKILESKSTPE